MSKLAFDERVAAQLEKLYATSDVRRRRCLVREALAARAGERVLDVGCGPGFYVAELLADVGPNGSVVGVDPSAAMLAVAARRCTGLGNATFREGEATSLPIDDESFDAAISVQVLEYVSDVASALREMRRVLRVGGRVVIWDVDWTTVSWHSTDTSRMTRVLRAWDEHLVHPFLPRTLASRLRAAGFENVATQGHVFATAELSPETYGGSSLPLIAEFVSGRGEVTSEEARAWIEDQRQLGERGEFFLRVHAVLLHRNPRVIEPRHSSRAGNSVAP
jgi:ubiquinone/menaquinone biosynthesis C-methylase UbiE